MVQQNEVTPNPRRLSQLLRTRPVQILLYIFIHYFVFDSETWDGIRAVLNSAAAVACSGNCLSVSKQSLAGWG